MNVNVGKMNYVTYEVFGFFTSGTSTHELKFPGFRKKLILISDEDLKEHIS